MFRLDASQRTRRVSSAAIRVAWESSAASRDDASSARPIGTAASVSTPPPPRGSSSCASPSLRLALVVVRVAVAFVRLAFVLMRLARRRACHRS